MAEKKVYYQVIEYIRDMVKRKEITFDGKLPSEREMMEELGLSRNSIREALRTMEHMGLIESRHGKGNYLVNHMGESLRSVVSMLIFMKESNFIEVNQLRRAMESEAFELVIDRLDEEGKTCFQGFLEKMPRADMEEMYEMDKAFHKALIQYSGNRILGTMMEALSEAIDETTRIVLKTTIEKDSQWWRDIHNCICQSIVEKDRLKGLDAIEEHYARIDQEISHMV